jgi:hypothetical protein
MNAITTIRRSTIVLLAATSIAILGSIPTHAALTPNLLVDPGFENPVLTPFTQILGPPFTTGVWGAENGGNVTGPVNAVSPAGGSRMHQQNNAGGVATQSWQLVNVGAYSTDINAGNAFVNASALFNASAGLPAALGSVAVSFFNGANTQLAPPVVSIGATPDANPTTWQSFGLSNVPVPATTQFIRLQLAYSNNSLQSPNGNSLPAFQDNAVLQLNIVPEPASAALAAAGLAGLAAIARTRKRRSGISME